MKKKIRMQTLIILFLVSISLIVASIALYISDNRTLSEHKNNLCLDTEEDPISGLCPETIKYLEFREGLFYRRVGESIMFLAGIVILIIALAMNIDLNLK